MAITVQEAIEKDCYYEQSIASVTIYLCEESASGKFYGAVIIGNESTITPYMDKMSDLALWYENVVAEIS